ncbi:hypothetical protein WG922_21565 [Ramlibacter sp. AN1015]|uniref:hypothetical protein n=1 Tax=Ramlibacter sp. AN1015 TaxID=3133428 RepID=UPI0030BE00B7
MGRVKKADDAAINLQPLAVESVAGKALPLLEYIAANEARKLAQGVVLVRVTHPEEPAERVVERNYSGVIVAPGPLGCLWSDGSTE